jgi:LAO/AO transport system kinase
MELQSPTVRPSVPPSAWKHLVLTTVAATGVGLEPLIGALQQHYAWLEQTGELATRRRRRLAERTREVVNRATQQWVWQETAAQAMIDEKLDEVAAGKKSPYEVAAEVLEALKQGTRI